MLSLFSAPQGKKKTKTSDKRCLLSRKQAIFQVLITLKPKAFKMKLEENQS